MTNHVNAVLYYGNCKIKTRRRSPLDGFRLWLSRRKERTTYGVWWA
jgi:hypothetical protein